MELQALQEVVDDAGSLVVIVDSIEDIASGFNRQCGDFRASAVLGGYRNAGSYAHTYSLELTQFVHYCKDLFAIRPLGIKGGLGVVEDDENLSRGKEGPQGSQIFWIFDPCTDHLGELDEEVGQRGCEFITADESTVVTELVLDAVVVKGGKGDGRLPDSTCTIESDGLELFGERNDFLDQGIPSEKGLWCRWRKFSKGDTRKMLDWGPHHICWHRPRLSLGDGY